MSAVVAIRPELDMAAVTAQARTAGLKAGSSFSTAFNEGATASEAELETKLAEAGAAGGAKAGASAGEAYAAGMKPGLDKAAIETTRTTETAAKKSAVASEGALAGVGKAHSQMMNLVTMGAGFAAYEGYKGAVSYQQYVNTSQIVFGNASKAIQNYSENAAKTAGLSATDTLQQLNKLGNVAKSIMGANDTQAAQMSKNLLQRSADIAVATGGDQQTILQGMTMALAGGQSRALRQYGVSLTQASLQQEALKLGLVKMQGDQTKANELAAQHALLQQKLTTDTAKYGASSAQVAKVQADLAKNEQAYAAAVAGKMPTLTAAQKSQAAYNLILQQTNAFNDYFAKHANDPAERLKTSEATFKNLQDQIGKEMIPTISMLLKGLDGVMTWFNDAPGPIKATILGFTAGTFVLSKFGAMLKGVKELGSDVSNVIKSVTGFVRDHTGAVASDTTTTATNTTTTATNTDAKATNASASAGDAGANAELAGAEGASTAAAASDAAAQGALSASEGVGATAAITDATAQESLAAAEGAGGAMGAIGGVGGLLTKGLLVGGGALLASGAVKDAFNKKESNTDILKMAGGGAMIGMALGGPMGALVGGLGGLAFGGTSYAVDHWFADGGTVYPSGAVKHGVPVMMADGGEPEDIVPHSKRSQYAAAVGGSGANVQITYNISANGVDARQLAIELDRLNRATASKYLRTTRVPA